MTPTHPRYVLIFDHVELDVTAFVPLRCWGSLSFDRIAVAYDDEIRELCRKIRKHVRQSTYKCVCASLVYIHTFRSGWTATGQLDRHLTQHQFVVLVKADELSQAGECFLHTRKTVELILNNDAVFIIQSKRGL